MDKQTETKTTTFPVFVLYLLFLSHSAGNTVVSEHYQSVITHHSVSETSHSINFISLSNCPVFITITSFPTHQFITSNFIIIIRQARSQPTLHGGNQISEKADTVDTLTHVLRHRGPVERPQGGDRYTGFCSLYPSHQGGFCEGAILIPCR